MRKLTIGANVAIVALLSASLLVGPVRATYADDTGKIIGGLVAAGLIWWAIDKSNDKPTSRAYHPYDRGDQGWRGDRRPPQPPPAYRPASRVDTWDQGWQYQDGWDKPAPQPVRAWADHPTPGFTVTDQDAQYFIGVQVWEWEQRHPYNGDENWFQARDKYAGKISREVQKFVRGEGNPPAGFAQVIAYGRANGYDSPPDWPQPDLQPPPQW